MNYIIVLSLLVSTVLGRDIFPIDFDYTKLKSISASPEYRDTVVRLKPEAIVNELPAGDEGNLAPRIIDSQLAQAGQFPHHVLLIVDNTYWCGGSILYENWVLTVSTRVLCN